MSKTCILCHVVFSTKYRQKTIESSKKRELYRYMYGIIEKRRCKVIRINGMEDHVHLLIDLHPSIALADLVKAIKQGSTMWLKENWIFPYFNGWTSGYFASSVGIEGMETCRLYIINQETHHTQIDFLEEIEHAVKNHGLEWREDDWE